MAFFEGQTFQSCLLKGRNFMFQQLRNIGCSYCKEWNCSQSSTSFIGMPEKERWQYGKSERSARQCPLLTDNRPCLRTPTCWTGGDNIQCEAEQLQFQGMGAASMVLWNPLCRKTTLYYPPEISQGWSPICSWICTCFSFHQQWPHGLRLGGNTKKKMNVGFRSSEFKS